MRLMSTLTRIGLIFLAGAMITVLGTAEIWDEEAQEVTTIDLANTMPYGLYHCSYLACSWPWP